MPTIIGTFSSFLAAPIGGLGVLLLLFGGWFAGLAFATAGLVLWFCGRRLMDR